jgi:hypothetical protein
MPTFADRVARGQRDGSLTPCSRLSRPPSNGITGPYICLKVSLKSLMQSLTYTTYCQGLVRNPDYALMNISIMNLNYLAVQIVSRWEIMRVFVRVHRGHMGPCNHEIDVE